MTNREMRPLKKPEELNSSEEVAEATAMALDQAACNYAHVIYWDNQFQKLARLDALEQVEQDRIFNELVLGCVVLLMLVQEAPDLRVSDDKRGFLKDVRDALPKAHVAELRHLGVEKEYLKDWEKLIDMRFTEYARDRHGVRAAAMTLESKDKDLALDDLTKIQLLLPVQTVGIGCHQHICRGETDGRDELLKLILRRLGDFYLEFRVRLEGGKITRLDRVRMAIRRFFRRLRKRLRLAQNE